ncbi:MAG: hypothetical protein EOO43_20825 [Flavobacterium sp.]|nr:MAG: hypothetical protein EOO43_20825 [Flavobacterium sp.]
MESNFEISLTTAVFTTRYVLDNASPVLHVYHFEDGSWQFCGSEQTLLDEDHRVISLSEILSIDSSLRMLGNLKVGFEATRSSEQKDWIIIPNN